MKAAFGEDSVPLFAGKALCFKGIYPIIQSEGLYADVESFIYPSAYTVMRLPTMPIISTMIIDSLSM